MYLIEILHQTTTGALVYSYKPGLYLIEILHQTTTMFAATRLPFRLYLIEILHQTTTLKRFILTLLRCILSKFYIKPQQRRQNRYDKDCCILSKFYIKPQPGLKPHGFAPVVSYRNSTSNHNLPHARVCSIGLYLIEILHQTTTNSAARLSFPRCILSKFYIKPQHLRITKSNTSCCILSKFYIKPQHPGPMVER